MLEGRKRVPHFLQWGLTPKVQTPITLDRKSIDFVPTTFFIVRRVLKSRLVKVIQVAPPEAAAPPPNRKTPISRFPIDNFWSQFTGRYYRPINCTTYMHANSDF